jgi:hypothetical protein
MDRELVLGLHNITYRTLLPWRESVEKPSPAEKLWIEFRGFRKRFIQPSRQGNGKGCKIDRMILSAPMFREFST